MHTHRPGLVLLLLSLLVAGCPSAEPTVCPDDDDATVDRDDDDSGDDDSGDDDDSAVGNRPPGFASVQIDSPGSVTPDDPFTCLLVEAAVDPDGDRVTYFFEWLVDDVLQPDITAQQITPGLTTDGENWKCRVTPTDGLLDGPASIVEVDIGEGGTNEPPSAPVVEVQPAEPGPDDALACIIVSPSIDPEGELLNYGFRWNQNGSPALDNQGEVNPSLTSPGEVWECVVTPDDGYQFGPPGSDSVTIGN